MKKDFITGIVMLKSDMSSGETSGTNIFLRKSPAVLTGRCNVFGFPGRAWRYWPDDRRFAPVRRAFR